MIPTQEELDSKIDELFKQQIGCDRIDNSERYVIKLIAKWYTTEVIKHCAEVATAYKEGAFGNYYNMIDVKVCKQSILNVINNL